MIRALACQLASSPRKTISSGARAPTRSDDPPEAARLREQRGSTTGRSGARPMPPATTTTSPPIAVVRRPQSVPKGPRTPINAPGLGGAELLADRADRADGVRAGGVRLDRR